MNATNPPKDSDTMNRIIAVALATLAIPFAFASCEHDAHAPTPIAPPSGVPFVSVYLDAITAGSGPAAGVNPLDVMAGR